MDCSKTIDFFSEFRRLCDSRATCEATARDKQCPLYDFCDLPHSRVCANDAIMAMEALKKWSDEHPVKTYAQDFFEKFPDAPKDEAVKGKCPWACRCVIYGGECPMIEPEIDCCYECWNEPMEE